MGTGVSCMVARRTGRGRLPVAARRCAKLLNLRSWAMVSAAGVVLSQWCFILGPSKIILTKASSN